MTGVALTVSVSGNVASGTIPFAAVSVMAYVFSVPDAGVPLIIPVAGSSCWLEGSVHWLRLTVGGGVPAGPPWPPAFWAASAPK